MKQTLIVIPLLAILLSGCAKSIRPGSIDAVDSKTYDTLLIAQSVLDNAKVAVLQGKLPASAKPIINSCGEAYNKLRDVWITYRANPDAELEQRIISATLELNRIILELRGLGVK